MLDATIIETAAAWPPHADGGGEPPRAARDPEAAFTHRQGKAGSHYGYKAHVGVDEARG